MEIIDFTDKQPECCAKHFFLEYKDEIEPGVAYKCLTHGIDGDEEPVVFLLFFDGANVHAWYSPRLTDQSTFKLKHYGAVVECQYPVNLIQESEQIPEELAIARKDALQKEYDREMEWLNRWIPTYTVSLQYADSNRWYTFEYKSLEKATDRIDRASLVDSREGSIPLEKFQLKKDGVVIEYTPPALPDDY